MNKICQIRFNDRKRELTVTFIINDISQSMTMSYADIRAGRVPELSGTRAHRLSYDELKTVAGELAKRFRTDPNVSLSPAQQFCLVLGHTAGVLHPAVQSAAVSYEQKQALKVDVKVVMSDLCEKAGTTPKEFREAISAGYCSGVDSLFCTDDYITLRQGDKVISRISFTGNDYNDLKNFLTQGGDRVLSFENVEYLRTGIRQMKLENALELANRKGTMTPGGLKLGDF